MSGIANSCLGILSRYGQSSMEFQAYFESEKHDLLLAVDGASALVTELVQSRDDRPEAAILFGLLLDEARMGAENDDPYGKIFLKNVETAFQTQVAAGSCEPARAMKISALYRRAGLPVPDILIFDPVNQDRLDPVEMPDLHGVFSALIAEVEASGGGSYEFFSSLDEMTAGMPEEDQAAFVNHLLTLNNPIFERCALYWLLSGATLIREAVAIGLREKLERSSLQSGTLFYLPIIRGWLPASAARAVVDDIGKLARQKGIAGAPDLDHQPIVGDIMASIADGVGAQSISIVGKRKKQTFVAMILLKAGYGIKDAFMIRCRSKREADNIISYARQEASGVRIDRITAELLLEAALADGIEKGHAPAPGFIDVMEACSLSGLRPQERDLQALLDYVDPQREIQNATTAQLDQMLNNRTALDGLFLLSESWFEDSGETRAIIQGSRSARTIEPKIWAFLEGRRDVWARRFLQTAIILKSANKTNQSKTLTAAAFALVQKRPLQDIPLMGDIVMATMEAGRYL